MRALPQPALHLATALSAPALALLRQLAQAALLGTLFVLAVWLLCRLAPRLPAGLRCALWWLACLKLLLGLAWPAPLALPLLPPAVAAAAGWLAPPTPPATPTRPAGVSSRQGTVMSGDARAGSATEIVPWSALARQVVAPTAGAAPAAAPTRTSRLSGFPPPAPSPPPAAPWWALGLACLWAAGVLRQIVRTARELRRVRGFLARSVPVRDPALLRLAADLGRALDLAPVELRAAPAGADLAAPLTAGALRPVVVLPAAGLERLSRQELAMALAHELVHVRRRDLPWGWIPAAAARLFFFLPPAALAAREYGLAREAACDAAVLRLLDATPASYGRLLVRLGVRGPIDPRQPRMADLAPAATVGGAAASLQQLKRRLEMLQHHQPDLQHRPARLRPLGFSLLALLALAALVPLRIVAAAPATTSQAAAAPAPAISPAAAASAPAVRPVIAATPAATAATPVVAATPTRAVTPAVADPAVGTAAVARVTPAAAASTVVAATPAIAAGASIAAAAPVLAAAPVEPRNGDSYVFLRGDSDVAMSGDTASIERARKLQREAGGADLLWMRHGGKEYVIRDAATLKEIREIFRPQEELGARQGKLGEQQGELGARQGELGSRQGKLGAQQGKLGARQGELGSRQGKLGAQQGKLGAEQGRLGAEQVKLAAEDAAGGESGSAARERREELEKEQEKLGAEMRELGEQQRELGRQQRELGEPQRRLGDQQRELGRQQERAAREAEGKLHALLDQAIARGTAQEVR